MTSTNQARALLNQASMMAYEAYGRYFAVNSPWDGNEVMSYNEWLEQDGKQYKFLVESMQQHLTELLYQSNISHIEVL